MQILPKPQTASKEDALPPLRPDPNIKDAVIQPGKAHFARHRKRDAKKSPESDEPICPGSFAFQIREAFRRLSRLNACQAVRETLVIGRDACRVLSQCPSIVRSGLCLP